MPQPTEEGVLEQIRKLLAMTTERGCSEQEAASAAKFAARLMAKHGITQEKLGAKSENEEHKFCFSRGHDDWQRLVAGGVSKKFGCAVYADFDGVVFFGRGDAPKTAGEVWSWLVQEMPRVALRQKAWTHGNTPKYMMGMATTVAWRLNEQDADNAEDAEADKYAIVRADTAEQEMMDAHPELEHSTELSKKIQDDKSDVAFLMGLIDGAGVALGTEKALES
jgi:Protein of unknown function (DUF2786)